MPKRKSAVGPILGTSIALRKSPRFLYQKKRLEETRETGSGQVRGVDPGLNETDKAPGGSRGCQDQKDPSKSTRSSSRSTNGLKSSRRNRRSNDLVSSSRRRSPRFLSLKSSDGSVENYKENVSSGFFGTTNQHLRKCVSGKFHNVENLSDGGNCKVHVASRVTRSRTVLAEIGSAPVDREKVNDLHGLKGGNRQKKSGSKKGLPADIMKGEMVAYTQRDVESTLMIDRGGSINGNLDKYADSGSKKGEIVLGLRAQGLLNCNGKAKSLPDSYVAKRKDRDGKKDSNSRAEKVEIIQGLRAKGIPNPDGKAGGFRGSYVTKTERRDGKEREGEMDREIDLEGGGTVRYWTEEQEEALKRAYYKEKPTPNFWKKVSKQVPGKSAQECFDKVHSYYDTPVQSHRRHKARKPKSSPVSQFSLSASKLLKPTERKVDKSRHRAKPHLTHKTIRQILEKQCLADGGQDADMFSVLEPDQALPATLRTPNEKGSYLWKYRETSSSGRKRPPSRFAGLSKADLESPPVLKQVKDIALHEKYIDLLHCRDAKRKSEFARASRKENIKAVHGQNTVMVRAAKNALIFGVKDAVSKLQSLREDSSSSSSNYNFNGDDLDEDGNDL